MTRTDATQEVARLAAYRKTLRARREEAYAAGATEVAAGLGEELFAAVETQDAICELHGLDIVW